MAIDWDLVTKHGGIPKVNPLHRKKAANPPVARKQATRPAKTAKSPTKPVARGKTGPTKKRRAKKRRAAIKVAGDDRGKVYRRQKNICVAKGISPVCTGGCDHPHELIPVSLGGPRESWNRVGICAADHRMTDSTLGGRRLSFDWPGKADGLPPNADQPGHVKPIWTERTTRIAEPGGGPAQSPGNGEGGGKAHTLTPHGSAPGSAVHKSKGAA